MKALPRLIATFDGCGVEFVMWAAIIGLALSSILLAADALPEDWRRPSEAETTQEWRQGSSQLYLVARADFDGDSLPDEAALLINGSGRESALVVMLSGRSPIVLERFDDPDWLKITGVEVAQPGRYRTACGKGYWKCKDDEPEVLVLEHPAINLFSPESSNSFFFYDPAAKSFRRVWMSD